MTLRETVRLVQIQVTSASRRVAAAIAVTLQDWSDLDAYCLPADPAEGSRYERFKKYALLLKEIEKDPVIAFRLAGDGLGNRPLELDARVSAARSLEEDFKVAPSYYSEGKCKRIHGDYETKLVKSYICSSSGLFKGLNTSFIEVDLPKHQAKVIGVYGSRIDPTKSVFLYASSDRNDDVAFLANLKKVRFSKLDRQEVKFEQISPR